MDNLPKMSESAVHAGFPSPAQDYMSVGIDLNKELVRHPDATFFVRVAGDSMTGAGIDDGDTLVVDRSLDPVDGCIAICCLEREFFVRRILVGPAFWTLKAENPEYKPVTVGPDADFSVWGVVSYIIKKANVRPGRL